MIAEVIVDIAHSDVDKIFDYACGEEILAGMRVVVPFGRNTVTGFVMRLKEQTDVPPEKLKRIYRAEEAYPALNAECLALAGRLAARYHVPLALVLLLYFLFAKHNFTPIKGIVLLLLIGIVGALPMINLWG